MSFLRYPYLQLFVGGLMSYLRYLFLQLFAGGLMSYLRYLCWLSYIGAQNILCCGFFSCFFSVFVLCTLCCQFLWIVHF
jgi:hypothetical protein